MDDRPEVLNGTTVRKVTGCGEMFITINNNGGVSYEIRTHLWDEKSGGCASCQNEALARIISLALNNDVSVKDISDELRGLRCSKPHMYPKNERSLSCADAISSALDENVHF